MKFHIEFRSWALVAALTAIFVLGCIGGLAMSTAYAAASGAGRTQVAATQAIVEGTKPYTALPMYRTDITGVDNSAAIDALDWIDCAGFSLASISVRVNQAGAAPKIAVICENKESATSATFTRSWVYTSVCVDTGIDEVTGGTHTICETFSPLIAGAVRYKVAVLDMDTATNIKIKAGHN